MFSMNVGVKELNEEEVMVFWKLCDAARERENSQRANLEANGLG